MIYFDNAATTPPLQNSAGLFYANPSSPHLLGIESSRALAYATETLAQLAGCKPTEIIFTSGGTESNNLALCGALKTFLRQGGTVLTTPYEHPSVSETLKNFCSYAGFSFIEAPIEEWEKHVNTHCVLASCAHVNHETGGINDVNYLAKTLKSINPKLIFHSDGAQGFCKENIDLKNIDLYSFSAHKFHGPLGMGGLFVMRGTRLLPVLYGGGQQRGLRPGTVNVPGIVQTVNAAKQMYINMKEHRANVSAVNKMIANAAREIPGAEVNRAGENTSPYILNISFAGVKGETLVNMLSERGVYASMGAACNAHKKGVSPLEKMGFSKERASSAVRFSFSRLNTMEEALEAGKILKDCVKKLRDIFGG